MTIQPISETNVEDVLLLLKERGILYEEFYRWKYLRAPLKKSPVGFIAYHGGIAIGCIGIINRTWIDAKGNEREATWFADWYTLKSQRKVGAGRMLMEAVRKQAPVALGIPGPAAAQAVAAKAGYHPGPAMNEYHVYLAPFRCGLFLGSDHIIRRIARSIFYRFKFPTRSTTKSLIEDAELIHDEPPIEQWTSAAKKALDGISHFERPPEWIDWIKQMPTQPALDRRWWYLQSSHYFACGFTENYTQGLRRAKILDVLIIDDATSFHPAVITTLKLLSAAGIDMATFSFSTPLQPDRLFHRKTQLPLFAGHALNADGIYLSTLDKESSWLDVR